MTKRRTRSQHPDSGAALLLAVGFVVMIGVISAALAGLATSSLNNRNSLELLRNRQYAADGAVETAISQVRASTCGSASGSLVDSTMNSISIRVDWTNVCGVIQSPDGIIVTQRNVIFSACLDTGAQCSDLAVPAVPVIIRAQVNFQQASGASVTKTYVQSWSVNR